MKRHIIGIRPDVGGLGVSAIVEVVGVNGIMTKTVHVRDIDRPDLIMAMEILRIVYEQLAAAALAAFDDPPIVCDGCGTSTRDDACPRCGEAMR